MRKADLVGVAGVLFVAGFAFCVWPPFALLVAGLGCLAYDVMH